MNEISKISDYLCAYLPVLGDFAKNQQQQISTVNLKDGLDIVTNVDYSVEQKLINHISKKYPNHRIFSEETSALIKKNDSEFTWVIDPIDGTVNYTSGLPFYSIAVCLKKNNKSVFSAVYVPTTGDMFTATKNKGSYKNNKRVFVSETILLSESVISFMLTSHYDKTQVKEVLKVAEVLSGKTRGVRIFVSFALELCYVASGILSGALSLKSSGFGSSAGELLVSEAGGLVTDCYGKEYTNRSKSIVATNNCIHTQVLTLVQEAREIND